MNLGEAKQHVTEHKELYIFGGSCFAIGALTALTFAKKKTAPSEKFLNELLDLCDSYSCYSSNTGIEEWDSAYTAGISDAANGIYNLLLRKDR